MEKDAGGRIRRIHCCTISHFPHCDFPPCVSCQHTVALHWTHSLQQAKDREILICSAQWTENGILLNLYSGTHSWIPFLCFQGNYSLRVALEPTKIALSDANKSKAVQMMHLERCCIQHDRLSHCLVSHISFTLKSVYTGKWITVIELAVIFFSFLDKLQK